MSSSNVVCITTIIWDLLIRKSFYLVRGTWANAANSTVCPYYNLRVFCHRKHLCLLFLFSKKLTKIIIIIIILAWLLRREVFKNCSITRRSSVAVGVDHPRIRGLFIEGRVASGVGATVVVNVYHPGESGGGQQQNDTNSLHLESLLTGMMVWAGQARFI